MSETPERFRAIVVDDEPLARHGIAALLARDAEVEVIGTFADGADALAAFDAMRPDILFLDVQMPGIDGFGVLHALAGRPLPAIVFVTAFDAFAVRAFDANAVDYLLKPFDDERFRRALARAKRERRLEAAGDEHARLQRRLAALIETVGAGERPQLVPPAPRLVVREIGRVTYVPIADIDWIEGASYYAKLHVGARTHMLRETLASLERRLDASTFYRVHRSAIVNVTRVRAIQPHFRGEGIVTLHDGTRLKLARGRRPGLDALLAESAGA